MLQMFLTIYDICFVKLKLPSYLIMVWLLGNNIVCIEYLDRYIILMDNTCQYSDSGWNCFK